MQEVIIKENKFFVLEPNDMNVLRNNSLSYSIEAMNWRVDPRDFDAFVKMAIEDIDKGKAEDAKFKLKYMQELRKMDIAYNPMIDAVCNFVLINDEKVDKIESKYILQKKQLCEADREVYDFFLASGIAFLRSINVFTDTLSASDLWKGIEIARDQEQALYKMLGLQIFKKIEQGI
jgi:hypothetical protein